MESCWSSRFSVLANLGRPPNTLKRELQQNSNPNPNFPLARNRIGVSFRSVVIKPSNIMQKIKVFLADDHTVVRQGLRALLIAEGDIDIVGEAANGRQAVQL